MSAYVLPNIILLVAILGLLAVVARHIPEAQRRAELDAGKGGKVNRRRLWFVLQGKLRSAWRFVLEAKGLRDPVGSKYRMKQLLAANKQQAAPKRAAARITASASSPAVVSRSRDEGDGIEEVTPVARPSQAQETSRPAYTPSRSAPIVQSTPAPAAQIEESMALAKQYLDNKQYFEARKLLDSMAQDVHASPVFWARLGYAQYHLGAYGEAIRCYEKSLALDSNQPNRYYNLALAYEAAGNRVKALSNLEKAIARDPGNAKYAQTQQALST